MKIVTKKSSVLIRFTICVFLALTVFGEKTKSKGNLLKSQKDKKQPNPTAKENTHEFPIHEAGAEDEEWGVLSNPKMASEKSKKPSKNKKQKKDSPEQKSPDQTKRTGNSKSNLHVRKVTNEDKQTPAKENKNPVSSKANGTNQKKNKRKPNKSEKTNKQDTPKKVEENKKQGKGTEKEKKETGPEKTKKEEVDKKAKTGETKNESEAESKTTSKEEPKETLIASEVKKEASLDQKNPPKTEKQEKSDEQKNETGTDNKKKSEQVIQETTKSTVKESETENDENAKETNNDIDLVISPENPEESPAEEKEPVDLRPAKQTSVTLMGVISFVFFGTIAICLLLSCYYRLHLLKNKRAPFNAPRGLKPLFPTPVNYEYEITQLCDKYLSQ